MKCWECHFDNLADARTCKGCGATLKLVVPESSFREDAAIRQSLHRCQWTQAGQQCPATGVMSPFNTAGVHLTIKRKDGKDLYYIPMYCGPHYDCVMRGDHSRGAMIMDDYERNGFPKRKLNWLEQHHAKLDRECSMDENGKEKPSEEDLQEWIGVCRNAIRLFANKINSKGA